jgi:glycosyltransferase involved in cell wall biosynthesis
MGASATTSLPPDWRMVRRCENAPVTVRQMSSYEGPQELGLQLGHILASMSLHVTLVGPASPQDLVSVLDDSDARRAQELSGSRGVPVTELAKALLGAGCRVSVVTGATGEGGIETFSGPGLELVVVPYRPRARHRAKDLYRAERHALTEVINSIATDVVHAHWTYEYALGALAVPDKPVLVTAHDAPFTVAWHQRDAYRAMRFAVAWWARSRIQNLTVVSPYLERAWRQQMVYRGPIAVTPNIIPVLTDGGAALPTRPKKTGAHILCVSDVSRLKNIPMLLRAFTLVLAQVPTAQLIIVGPGLEKDGVTATNNRQYTRSVTWRGPVSRATLYSYYDDATVLVHPSKEESFGLTIVEAMSLGVPVVAGASSGAVPWLLDGGRSGRLVDVGSVESIATGILAVIQDPSLAQQYVAAARLRLAKDFSADSVVRTYLREYKRIIEKG